MEPAALPDYDFLPAPLSVVTVLHLLTLTLHLVAMNCLFGGLVTVLFGGIDDRWRNPAVQRVVRLLPTLMAATVTLGVAPLLFVQLTYGGVVYAASIVSGWYWLLIPFSVIVGYYFLYGASFSKRDDAPRGVWLGVALACLVFVALVYSSVFSMAERPDVQKELYAANQSGLLLDPNVGEWLFRWLHMLTGATMVGALFVALVSRGDEQVSRAARRVYVIGLVLAAVTGVAYVGTLGDALRPFMRSPGIGLVTVGAVLALVAAFTMLKGRLLVTTVLTLVSLATMVVARHTLRLVVLPEPAHPATVYADKVVPQWDVFGIFVVCLVIAVALVWTMLRLFFTDRPDTGAA